ncbi:MAG: hypothetical protein CVT99_06815 [Bacteroidetes bacterium HGW-Bacteroidetes-16]|jgi:hypothetical protein|nr:MAG: hypothetical protein CVT99_06815 [Bacteroidetes bacterium HGW-Bacteroidetes-16]
MRILFLVIAFSFVTAWSGNVVAQNNISRNLPTDAPLIDIHDAVVAPGELLLQVDALNFTGDQGQVAAITLRIEFDTLLVEFLGIQNMTIPGSWLANYNLLLNEITITYTAPFGVGHDLNGKLLDLKLNYFGGFSADLEFKPGCEISNKNLQTITGVVYEGGTISQIPPVGSVQQDSVVVISDEIFQMPLIAQGAGYDLVNKVFLRVGYDSLQLQYNGFVESAISGVTVSNTGEVLIVAWENDILPINFTEADTLLFLTFKYVGDTNTITSLLPGSKVYNNGVVAASVFSNGVVRSLWAVELLNNPDTAGIALGGGSYFIGDTVTITAIPEPGFHFTNWTKDTVVVSDDSVYTFVKATSDDTLVAGYLINSYEVFLVAIPTEGGNVLGSGSYSYGSVVTVSANASTGYHFICWMLNNEIVSYEADYTFVMPPNDVNLSAVFGIDIYTISAMPNNPDYGTTSGSGEYSFGDTVTLVATPFEEYRFIAWTEGGQAVSYDSMFTFIANANRNLIANFQYITDCSAPVGLFADNLSETSALLYWLPSGIEQEWELLWGTTGFDTITGGELVSNLVETQYQLENLNPGTGYDFYVRAVCSDLAISRWSDPSTFTTWYVGITRHQEPGTTDVYPNPVNQVLQVVCHEDTYRILNYTVINTAGLRVMDSKTEPVNTLSIPVGHLPPGVYILRLIVDKALVSQMFIKK